MTLIKATATAALVLYAQQASADVYNHFNAALAALPATTFQQDVPATFLNLHALSMEQDSLDLDIKKVGRSILGGDFPVVRRIFSGDDASFRGFTGIAPYEVEFVAGFSGSGKTNVIWGVEQSALPQLAAHLPQAGFSPVLDVDNTFTIGELVADDPTARDETNPWIDARGQPSMVYVAQTVVLQSSSTFDLDRLSDIPSAYDHKAGLSLSEVYGHGPDLVNQAMFFSHGYAVLTELGKPFADQPFIGGMLADIRTETGMEAAFALVFDTCEAANAMRDAFSGRIDLVDSLTVTSATLETPNACVAEFTLTAADPASAGNPAFDMVHALLEHQAL